MYGGSDSANTNITPIFLQQNNGVVAKIEFSDIVLSNFKTK